MVRNPHARPVTSLQVQQTRSDLLAAFSNPVQIPGKAAAYAAAVKRHREVVFAGALRDLRLKAQKS